MVEFSFTVRDPIGIHARPAGMLAKEAKKYVSRITVSLNGKTADASRLVALMGLGAKAGAELLIRAEGEDETAAAEGILSFLEKNL